MGDFNFPTINWEENVCLSSESSLASYFLDDTHYSLFFYHSMLPILHNTARSGQQSSLLDLVFTSDPNITEEINHLSPLVCSDHDCLIWSLKCYELPLVNIMFPFSTIGRVIMIL